MTIYTVGHSTRPPDEFIALLRAHAIEQIADVRTVPRSRRHPHFSREALEQSLPAAGVAYRHFGQLGGLRKPRKDSSNIGWRHEGFRGYADYRETAEFVRALDALVGWAGAADPRRTAVMCAEAVWWRCHRQLIADALVASGSEVRHIVSMAAPLSHSVTEFAKTDGNRVTYPGLI
jgi:uncharacterized protein (DUF488 family)